MISKLNKSLQFWQVHLHSATGFLFINFLFQLEKIIYFMRPLVALFQNSGYVCPEFYCLLWCTITKLLTWKVWVDLVWFLNHKVTFWTAITILQGKPETLEAETNFHFKCKCRYLFIFLHVSSLMLHFSLTYQKLCPHFVICASSIVSKHIGLQTNMCENIWVQMLRCITHCGWEKCLWYISVSQNHEYA